MDSRVVKASYALSCIRCLPTLPPAPFFHLSPFTPRGYNMNAWSQGASMTSALCLSIGRSWQCATQSYHHSIITSKHVALFPETGSVPAQSHYSLRLAAPDEVERQTVAILGNLRFRINYRKLHSYSSSRFMTFVV